MPQMMPIVYSGKEKATMRYATLSSVAAAGRRAPKPVMRPIFASGMADTRSYRCLIRNSRVSTVLVIRAPSEDAARVTWMASQYDCSAGTNGWALEYSTVPARNIIKMTGARMNPPRCRICGTFHISAMKATTATSPAAEANSYMFDHGTESTANPRMAIDVAWTRAPTI